MKSIAQLQHLKLEPEVPTCKFLSSWESPGLAVSDGVAVDADDTVEPNDVSSNA